MIPSKYKFYLGISSNTDSDSEYTMHSINPVYKKLTKKYAKESNQQFFRKSIRGNIELLNKDFELVYNASINQNMLFIINKQNATTGEWYEYYKGKFNKTDCKFDVAKKKCEPKLSALDQYTDILNGYEDTYDLIKLAPAISKINMCKRPILQIYIAGENIISNYLGGTYWETDVNEAVDNKNELINKYFFSKLITANEFKIEGFTNNRINGIYAGQLDSTQSDSSGSLYATYRNNKGVTAKVLFPTLSSGLGAISIYDGETHIAGGYFKGSLVDLSDKNDPFFKPFDGNIDLYENGSDTQSPKLGILNTAIHYQIYQRLLCDVDKVNGTETHDLPYDDFVSDNRNYRKCVGISSGNIFCSIETSSEPTKYGVNDYNQYFTNKAIYDETGLRPLPISRNAWVNVSLWYVYNTAEYKIWEAKHRKQYTLKDSYSIASVIKVLLNKIDASISHEETEEYSKFLYGGAMEPLKWDNFKVYITQKTNILKGQYDQAAQKAEITLKNVMDMLRDCFRCYWYIEDNKLKIEHVSFFMKGGSYSSQPGVQLDFTKLKDAFNKRQAQYFQSEIEYDKSELAKRYEFNWMDDVTELFGPVNIDVKANYVQQDKTDEITINNFSSDVDFMLLSPSNFSDDGFVLLCPIVKNNGLELPIITSSLVDENGRSYEMIAQNWYASWPYLVSFYKYDMPAYDADVDVWAEPFNINGIKRCMTHKIDIHTPEDLNELQLITTSLGDGYIEDISVNLDTRLTEIKLAYVPE